MTGTEFLRKLRKIAKDRRVEVSLVKERGKGSHSTVYFGSRRTTIRNLKDDLKTGTLAAMLKQLGLELSDLH